MVMVDCQGLVRYDISMATERSMNSNGHGAWSSVCVGAADCGRWNKDMAGDTKDMAG